MERKFWEERWAARQIGFHEGSPNALLVAHAPRLEGCTTVYVPLCGKAEDVPYLRSRGHAVVGTEIVRTAIDELFERLAIEPEISSAPPFVKLSGEGVTLFAGDAFALEVGHTGGPVDAIYDRAALVALDPKTRGAYVRSLVRVLRPLGKMLLVAFDYPQHAVNGPPWSVSDADVHALFEESFTIELLEERRAPAGPKFTAVGITELGERAYLLQKRG